MLLWSCSRKVVRFPVTLFTTCILLLPFTELFFPLKCCAFSSSICFRLKRNLNWKTWKFWKPIEKRLTWLTLVTDWQILHVAKNIWRISNGNRTEWSPIRSVIIRVLTKSDDREAHSFLRPSLSENCSLLGTDNVRGQMSEHIFAANGGYCFCKARKK